MNRKKLAVIVSAVVAVIIAIVVTLVVLLRNRTTEENVKTCDKSENALLPFCDSTLSADTRIQDLIGRLTVQEKIGLLVQKATGASEYVLLQPYNWWQEALHGVLNGDGNYVGTFSRPPTVYATVFPQIISLSTSFDRDLFFRMANATGNEARAFYNAGNSGLTFWSPNINIYRDPRWGRGQETPGEDPYLSGEYARMFVKGLQGDEQKVGFLKASACCKHFAAHSIEEDRNSFNAVVNQQDMADTYLPAFKVCVENNVTSIMTAYSAINGIPATAHKYYITEVIRRQWGFDGYIVSDCGAVGDVFYNHHYKDTESDTCHAVLDAGVDIECGSFYTSFLLQAFYEGLVTEALLDTALSRGFRVLMRLGYFENEDTRPYKEFLPEDIDSEPHKQLSLEAARRSIVLLKNNLNELTSLPLLPLNQQEFGPTLASLALIGPHLNASNVFLGNYHGIPSSIKVPLDEIQTYVSDLNWELGCEVDSIDNDHLNEAEERARTSSQVILFVGINTEIEGETGDRSGIALTGLQPELIRRVLSVAQRPVILVVVSGGVIDLSEYKDDPRVGAIIWAGYIGQSGGEAIADVLFGNYNPSGRLTQTFYDNSYLQRVTKQDMNMRPVNGSPGRTYRFYTGEPVYPFGYGLSYTTFEYVFSSENVIQISQLADECVDLVLEVRNVGQTSGDHSILWFLAPPNAGEAGRPIKNLVDFEKLHDVLPSESRQIQICLRSSMFQLANEQGEFEVILGEWTLMVGDQSRSILVTSGNTCDHPQNALLPFCDSSSPIDTRVQDLVSRLTVQEKIGLLVNKAAGASENVLLQTYNWWQEALHGVMNGDGVWIGSISRPPTVYATVFPQIISFSASFDKDLFFRVANATGNEARAFYNAGNSGLTFWSPNINIYRDPRWGRGQETPGEDPYLSGEYARMFVKGLQGDEERVGFLKASACCKHFAAHSIEENRNSFDAVVNQQDMADTYLPAFKVCVENNVSSIMTAYSAINGIPATAHKYYITEVIRRQWGFDGYIVSDCDAVDNVFYDHHYKDTESDTCHAVLDAGVDVECGRFYTRFLQQALAEGLVTEAMIDTALSRGFRVLMRLGYFEKEDTRPYKEFIPEDIDSDPHKQLSLEAARRSIVLLKNNLNELTLLPLLPLNQQDFGPTLASLALIGPHLNASNVFLGNYHGIPSSIKVPLDEIQTYVSDLKWEPGCEVNSVNNDHLNEAEEMARTSSQVILFVGINSGIEGETGDRSGITLTGLQPELIRRVLSVAQRPVILVVVSGGVIDLSEYKDDPRVGAIVWAGYIGQSGGEAIADVLFGNYNPSGRLTQTFYDSSYLQQVIIQDMNMRPVNGSPGRTYRFYNGEPVYPFGYGLSYTTFEYVFSSENVILISQFADQCVDLGLEVRNVGQTSSDHSILWFLAPPNAGEAGRPIKNLVDFEKLHDVLPSESRQIQICLRSSMFQLANEQGEFEVILGEWTLMVGDQSRSIFVTSGNTCDDPRNSLLPFCDSSSPIDTRIQDLVSRLTVQEKVGLLSQKTAGASANVLLRSYNWWQEALHGIMNGDGVWIGSFSRPPTVYATVFPQIISLSASFDRDLFFRQANATGNEARAFYNADNSGLTFWSPNINIYRDPRWGRGQETPGEDPYLSGEYARMFVKGLQGDEERVGFLKASACCKHFAAHSIEEGRYSFNAVVNQQDMADTYLPAFKVCVENNVTGIMTAYNAINGIPATAHKYYITEVIRGQWGFDGYIVSDDTAVENVFYNHHYEDTESGTCHTVLDAGVDIECGDFYIGFLQQAVAEGVVTEAMLNTALSRGFRVLMRLGYFEKEDTRPYKEFIPEDIDSEHHKLLALEGARRSIVLLKNNLNELTSLPLLPLNQQDFGETLASLALIGPHLNASNVFLGNVYQGIPSSIKVPLDEIQMHVPDLKWELGCEVISVNNDRINEAEELARTSSQVVLFVGINSQVEGEYGELGDRADILLTGLQPELISRVLSAAQRPVILFVVSGGGIDLSEYKDDPRVGAIVWAGYIGQSGGEAIADVLFGNYNPSGRLTQTFYDNSYLQQVIKQDMNMRPVNGSPGRTYRFYTGEPVYPFGYGLSYTTFEYAFSSENVILISQFADECVDLVLEVRNVGQTSGDHSILWFLAPPNAGEAGRPIKNLVDFEKLHDIRPSETRQIQICLRSSMFQLANEQGEFEVILGEWTLMAGDQSRSIVISSGSTCDKPRNALLPFCDSNSPINTRVQDLVSRLTVQEKIGLLVNRAAGASENVQLDYYNWWNEALHGVANDIYPNLGTHFRPPTEHSTVFPQIISLSTSFDRDLFFRMANATGNEARAFYNAGNAGLTFWSPNINIFRDPRWGRGQETPGEDPYLTAEYARMFVKGLQGDEERVGFLKASACCKHFAAHSIEEDRNSFDAVVNQQDMADTYLPAFKVCVENNVTSIMTAYSAINGIPATAHKYYIMDVIREQWGFDGYVVSDCGAVDDVFYNHQYEDTESGTCHAVLDSGVDIECGSFYTRFLQQAVAEELVTEAMMNSALSRGFRVLMRLGYFEKDETRPYKEFLPENVDSEPHKQLSLEAARRSIVLLKNDLNEMTSLPLLPLNQQDFDPGLASMALIGPHLNASVVFMGNYHGIPSSIKVPLDEIQTYVPDLNWEVGCEVDDVENNRLNEAEELASTSSQVILFVGINSEVEAEFGDRPDILLTGLQPELISRVLSAAQRPVILFVVSGGVIDLSEYKDDPRVGAIVWAGYIGQSGGEAIADILFGNYNPSGRLTQTFYDSSYLQQVIKQDMNMRPVNGSPGRTYRFYTGEPVYPFGYGLSYTTFEYAFSSENVILISQFADECLEVGLEIRNVGQRSGDHSILWFLAPPNAGEAGRPIKNLVDFEKINDVLPSESRQTQICLRSSMFQLANEQGEFEVILGEWTLKVGDQSRSIFVTSGNTCDDPRNALLPFCDSSSPIDTRIQDLVSRLTVQEKVGLLSQKTAGASANVLLRSYNWWQEALHGIMNGDGVWIGSFSRPPTVYATVFPQIISLSTSFDRDLFFRQANATGNEARAFYNADNSGLTFWSPNINIYRDPRWGRGQETPGEDPYLSGEYARMFVKGLQGDEERVGFLKASACCKHFAAHSIEEGRYSFNAVVNQQDMADTYLPAFKVCVENNVTGIMTAYNAINGIPATAHKYYITEVIRGQWGFDGYIVSDDTAVENVFYNHHYEDTESGTCHTVLDAGVDIECGDFYIGFLQQAVAEGVVTEAMLNTALSRGFRVLMRLGYFEKEDTRPYKEFIPEDIDSEHHKLLALEGARRSIVLLKNNLNELTSLPLLPLNQQDFGETLASLALIGPHLNASNVFLGNVYQGIPSSIKVPLDEIQMHVPDLKWELGCEVISVNNDRINEAEELTRTSSQVVLFVGINSQVEGEYGELGDRADILLTGLQPELISRVLSAAQRPVILFVVSGGGIDLSEYKDDPRVGAIVWAGYIGQSGGEAIADVLFGNYNPSGRLTQTFYDNSYLQQVIKQDMNMRPVNGSPGRTYRFYTGEPVYPFGYGLSYTTFEYAFSSENVILISQFADECVDLVLEVRNVGQTSGDHSILWFLAPPNAGEAGRPIKNLVDFEKLHDIRPSETRQIQICLRSSMFQLANEQGEFEVILGEWTLMAGDQSRSIVITSGSTCDKPRNALLPFCDSNSPINTRVQDLVSRLTVQEKIGLLVNRAAGASENVQLDYYNWWNEALHGVANDIYPNLGTHFRPPTEHSTVFPQIISLSTSFDRDLFFGMANATGNEARAFYNAGNAGLTFWSPNINIFRDPRWGRGQETPGEDPYLTAEYARMFVKGLQGDEERVGFLKASACCKHFAAHSIEEDRNSFDAVVNQQDMADTYLPAFKVCVENNVTSIMTAYSAINGIPATAHKYYIMDVIREQWGFDGYVVSDCGAVDDVFYNHQYEDTESGTCHAVLDSGVDIECGSFYTRFLQQAVAEELVTEAMMNSALSRGFRVLMRLGYFEKDETRPYKEFLPENVDSEPHKQLSLEAARRSIVLLKNDLNEMTSLPLLPLNQQDFDPGLASMALIGPHLNASVVFMGNYHGIPSSIKVPLDEIQTYVPDLNWEVGCEVDDVENNRLNEAEELASTSSQVILFVGINSEVEAEFGDRPDILLTGLQPELISRVLSAAQRPVILFVVSGGVIDLSEYKDDPRVGAIVWAGYIGQSGGEAIADILFGNYNPSGRLTQTFYDSSYLQQVIKQDMNMRPVNGSPGRTYRFYTGEPVYPFGYGLSYTTFEYAFSSENVILISQFADECLEVGLEIRNVGQRSGDHSILWFLAPPNAGEAGRPIKNLVDFEKINDVLPSESRQTQICLRSSMFQLANEQGEFEVILGEWTLKVGDQSRSIFVTSGNTCDDPRNALLPFCDSSSPIDTRIQDLVSRLTVQEKVGLLSQKTAGASANVLLRSYNWWQEALHGIMNGDGVWIGSFSRPPTVYATVFPQIISLSTSFDRDLFFRQANATGNEARAFYNADNSGLTFWSPNINIYRDPRWGRGQETPGEDPYLSGEYARMFVKGLQGDEERVGFLKASACCKHFAAHSIEEGRYSFNAVVNQQDMADTYLPAFKVCVENNVTGIMTAYNAINGIPVTAHKYYLTEVIRGQWGFDGYIVSDDGAVENVFYNHHYEDTESGTCHAVLDAGIDIECGDLYIGFLQQAVAEGVVTEAMLDTALSRGFRVLMRLGYFEKEDTRPYKEFIPEDIDSEPHKLLALEGARRSIVLLKNNLNELTSLPLLPLNQQDFGETLASLALIGPHLNASNVFLGNVYQGIPSSIKVPLDEIQMHVPDLKWELGCEVISVINDRINEAEELARTSSQVVLFVGINSQVEGEYGELGDRANILLTGLQPELISRVLSAAQRPVILFVVSGGGIDLSEYKDDPRVGAMVWAGYIGQSGGEAIADVLFGNYNPSGRLTQTFYDNSYLQQVIKQDMNMRPVNGSPGRTYRFYTGEPVYPFGFGLSYTAFEYAFSSENVIQISQFADECLDVDLEVRNVGQTSGDHSVLWFLAPPNAGQAGRPIKNLVDFEKLHDVLPSESRQIQICLSSSMFQLANEVGEFEVILGEWTLMVGDGRRSVIVS